MVMCFWDVLGSASREPHWTQMRYLSQVPVRSDSAAILLQFRCEFRCDSAANGAGHWWHLMNTLDVLLLIRIHHAVGSRVSDIRRSVYGISLHIFAVQLSLMHRAPTAMVCASSSRPSWGKVLCGARRAVVAEMKRGALCLCLGVSINGESPKWLVYKVYNGLKGKIPLKWMI